MAGSAQDVQRQIVSMIISQRLQDQADEKRNQQRLQESILSSQIARREKLEDEQRKFKQQLLMKGVDAKLEAARAGENVDLGGLPELLVSQIGGVQQDARKEQAYQALTQATFDPGNGNLDAAQAAAFQAGLGSPTMPGSGWEKTNKEIVRRRALQQGRLSEKALETRTVNQENRDSSLALSRDQTSDRTRIEGYGNRLASGEITADQLDDRLAEEMPNATPTEVARFRADALNEAATIRGNQARKMAGAEGPTQYQMVVNANKERLRAMRENPSNPAVRMSEDALSVMATEGQLVHDPLIPGKMYVGGNKKDAEKFYEKRLALGDLIQSTEMMENLWQDVKDNKDWTVGPFVGSPEMQNLFRVFGAENPQAAAFSALQTTLVTRVNKSENGSRASDQDFARAMVRFPTLSEINSESGDRRLRVFRDQLKIEAQSPFDPKKAEAMARLQSQAPNAADRRLRAAADRLDRAMEKGDEAAIVAAKRDFDRMLPVWQREEGDRWTVPGDVKKDENDAAREARRARLEAIANDYDAQRAGAQ